MPGDDGLGEPLLARGVHQVVAHLHRVAESLDGSLRRGRRLVPRPSDGGIDEQHREGAERPGWGKGLGLLDGQPHRRVVEEAAIDEVAPAELELLAAPGSAVGGTGQTAERLSRQGPRTLIGGDLALPIAARSAAFAHRSRSEGDGKGCRGEQRLDPLVGRNVRTRGVHGVCQGGGVGCQTGGPQAGVAAEPGNPGSIHLEEQRHHRLL